MTGRRTKHPSRARVGRMLDRMAAARDISLTEAGAQLDAVLAEAPADTVGGYLTALCNSWLGHPQQRSERSDRGQFHRLPEPAWSITCATCGQTFSSPRWDARYCSPACRQRAYRERRS